jgi:hypothetical protein
MDLFGRSSEELSTATAGMYEQNPVIRSRFCAAHARKSKATHSHTHTRVFIKTTASKIGNGVALVVADLSKEPAKGLLRVVVRARFLCVADIALASPLSSELSNTQHNRNNTTTTAPSKGPRSRVGAGAAADARRRWSGAVPRPGG